MNIIYDTNAIAEINGCSEKVVAIHSHNAPEKVMELMQKGTFSELIKELASHEGCISSFKEFKKKIRRDLKQTYRHKNYPPSDDIAKMQAATHGISSDTKMMVVLEKRIEQLTSNMFEQQDKSPEPSEKTEEK